MTTISKETVQRLLKDVKDIIKNPLTDHGIYYIHDDEDMLKGYALIIGPINTPYFGGNYFFELSYPVDYPHSPPKVKYCTNGENIRFNPNLYKCGRVCVSILNTWKGDQWTSCQSISTVLLNLCTLFCEQPLLNEPGVTKNHKDLLNYNKIIEYANLKIAVGNIILKKQGYTFPFFDIFYPFVLDNFKKNAEKIIDHSEKMKTEYPQPVVLITDLYNMKVSIHYDKVVEDLYECKNIIQKDLDFVI